MAKSDNKPVLLPVSSELSGPQEGLTSQNVHMLEVVDANLIEALKWMGSHVRYKELARIVGAPWMESKLFDYNRKHTNEQFTLYILRLQLARRTKSLSKDAESDKYLSDCARYLLEYEKLIKLKAKNAVNKESRQSEDKDDDTDGSVGQKVTVNRIREWREKVGISQEDLAEAAGISVSYLSRMEAGKRNVSLKNLQKLAEVLNVSPRELVSHQNKTVPLVGYVSAGSLAHLFDQEQTNLDEVDAPDDATESTVAVEIRGESLGAFFDGWIAFYDSVRRPVTSDLIGYLCIVRLSDGRTLIKKLKSGSMDDRFTLESQFEPPMYDQEIDSAAKITGMRPRG